MNYVTSDTNYKHNIDFIVDGDLVSPSAASYSLLDGSGNIVNGIEDISIPLTGSLSKTSITIPSSANHRVLDTDIRYVVVKFTYDGSEYVITSYYILKSIMLFPVTIPEIEAVIGVTLPSELIDIQLACDEVTEEIGYSVYDEVASGSTYVPAIIQAVKYKAASNACVNIQSLMMKSEQADNTLYTRYDKFDFEGLEQKINSKYSMAINKINGLTGDTVTVPVFSMTGVGTDAVTGE